MTEAGFEPLFDGVSLAGWSAIHATTDSCTQVVLGYSMR